MEVLYLIIYICMYAYVYLPKYLTQLNKTLIYLSQNQKKKTWNENTT